MELEGSASTTIVVVVFVVVYLGMMLGRLPYLKVDRSAIALLGAIALLATGVMTEQQAVDTVGYSTIALLFGLMVVSAQFTMSGLYAEITHRVVSLDVGPRALLAILIAVCGVLAALLTNDVIALAMAPVLMQLCKERRLNPVPYLLAMACSVNAGSTATIIGAPQNMLIGQHMHLSFTGFMVYTAVPAILSLGVIWLVVSFMYRNRWQLPATLGAEPTKTHEFDRLESTKGLIITAGIIGLFLFTNWPREQIALAAAGILLMNAHFKSRKMLDLVDWQLLVLFIGLFVVNGAFQQTHIPQHWVESLNAHGVDFQHPATLFVSTFVLSDIVSNVPAIMLLIPFATDPVAGPTMALAAGMASNLIVIGSIANIIVVDTAARYKLTITFWQHARTGIPVTLVSLSISAAWLWFLIGRG
ncbi:MAG: SLC13 family permease [Pseudomonadota bacterium]|nr:SLC13 family permease [Pseudomonadota bacterium]